MNEHLQTWRAALLWFDEDGRALYEEDGLLITQQEPDGVHRVHTIGNYQTLKSQFQQLKPTHWPDRLIAPGFVDMHIHYPQLDVIGSPAEGLLPWLTQYTFVQEAKFVDPAHAHDCLLYTSDAADE